MVGVSLGRLVRRETSQGRGVPCLPGPSSVGGGVPRSPPAVLGGRCSKYLIIAGWGLRVRPALLCLWVWSCCGGGGGGAGRGGVIRGGGWREGISGRGIGWQVVV